MFKDHVAPRIATLESALTLMPRKIAHAMSLDNFARVQKLADDALEIESRIAELRAMENENDAAIAQYLAMM